MSAVQWVSKDPRTGAVVPYADADNIAIERSYQQNRAGTHSVLLGGYPFTIHFSTMTQTNASGGSRAVMRRTAHPVALRGSVADQIEEILKSLTPTVISDANGAIAGSEGMCDYITENMQMFHHKFLPKESDAIRVAEVAASCRINSSAITDVFACILKLMFVGDLSQSDADFSRTNPDDYDDLRSIDVGMPVPPYFANVRSEGIFRRKYLSLLGLRNLSVYGPQIFGEFFETLFSSNPADYTDDGVARMKLLTGNVVDLDTVVLNCSSQLKAVNDIRSRENQPPFPTPDAFFSDKATVPMVISQADHLLKMFCDQLGIDAKVAQARKIALNAKQATIPIATQNTDRGRWPVWGYSNVGVFTYHANVPHLPDVIGALLKAPFQIAKGFLMCLTNAGVLADGTAILTFNAATRDKLAQALREFYADAVNDSCFNAKWKAIEAFIDKLSNVDSIDMVIAGVQASNQGLFKSIFEADDEKRTKEMEALVSLISGKGVKGRDPSTKAIRVICKQDIERWITATM